MLHHVNGTPDCPSCTEKLLNVHFYLSGWYKWAKENHPEIHIAWGYRDEQSQDDAYNKGLSKLKYPNSKHNSTLNGVPCARALDVFQLINDQAIFDKDFCTSLRDETDTAGFAIRWGGDFQNFPDLDHFEMYDNEELLNV